MTKVGEILRRLYTIYDDKTFVHRLSKNLERMDRVLQLMEQYDQDKLQRRAWAEKMQSRNMKHFFDEDFYEVSKELNALSLAKRR